MKLFDLLRLSLRSLWRRKLRTALTILSVMVGSMAVIALVALALGAQNVFLQQFESFGLLNQVTVVAKTDVQEIDSGNPFAGFGGGGGELAEGARPLDDALIEELSELEYVTSVSPEISVFSLETLSVEGSETKIRADVASKAVALLEYVDLSDGRGFEDDEERNVVILPAAFAAGLGYEESPHELIGQTVRFEGYEGRFFVDDELPDYKTATQEDWQRVNGVEAEVIGIVGTVDNPGGPNGFTAFVSVGWAKELLLNKQYDWEAADEERDRLQQEGIFRDVEPEIVLQSDLPETGYGSLAVQVDDTQHVEAVAERIKEFNVEAISSKEILDQILQVFDVIEIVLGAIGAISLLVASIGIANTMVMAIYERTKEIGLMKAVGATRGAIWRLFTAEAAFLGFWGGVAGVAVGYAISLVANEVANRFLAEDGIAATDIVQLPWWLIFGMLAFTTVIGTLAGLYPAARAARLNPIDALWRE